MIHPATKPPITRKVYIRVCACEILENLTVSSRAHAHVVHILHDIGWLGGMFVEKTMFEQCQKLLFCKLFLFGWEIVNAGDNGEFNLQMQSNSNLLILNYISHLA